MTEIPTGLIDGKAPLLTDFVARRRGVALRRHQLRAIFSMSFPPASLVAEFNHLSDILSGRRPA